MTPELTGLTTTTKRQPSKHARQRVRDAFDAASLARICVLNDFGEYAQRFDLADSKTGRHRFYYYADNGSNILATAHLDSVQDDGRCTVTDTSAGLLAVSGTLDDRLGAYVILELLPRLGIVCDWLLTTDEEIGSSTAAEFYAQKGYDWMFSFDRGGTDVVMYDYETPALVKLVEKSGARVGTGSFSDICMLDDLGCTGFNWGVGYQDYHGPRAHAWLEDTFRMVARFVKFYKANHATYLPYEPRWAQRSGVTPVDSLSGITDAEWWQATLVADCGHAVDLDDLNSYVEQEGGSVIVCYACGTIDDLRTGTTCKLTHNTRETP